MNGGSFPEQAVTVLRFSGDGSVLLSGGEDTVALAWLLMDLLDASAPHSPNQAPQPLHTWYHASQPPLRCPACFLHRCHGDLALCPAGLSTPCQSQAYTVAEPWTLQL